MHKKSTPKIKISYDELFKIILKDFFESHNFSVITDNELINLPKSFDLLIIKKNESHNLPFFNFLKTYNIISYKSVSDRFSIKDYNHLNIYYYGYILSNKDINYNDIQPIVISTFFPRKLFSHINFKYTKIKNGLLLINKNEYNIYFIIINELDIEDKEDLLMLLPFASNPKKRQLFSYIKNNKDLLDKILANIYEYLYFIDKDNYIKYIGEPPMNKKFVTLELAESLVKQYEKKGWEKGLLQGKQEGWEKGLLQGKQEGEYKKAITTVIKMYKKGYSLIEISEIIDLPISKVKEILRLN